MVNSLGTKLKVLNRSYIMIIDTLKRHGQMSLMELNCGHFHGLHCGV